MKNKKRQEYIEVYRASSSLEDYGYLTLIVLASITVLLFFNSTTDQFQQVVAIFLFLTLLAVCLNSLFGETKIYISSLEQDEKTKNNSKTRADKFNEEK